MSTNTDIETKLKEFHKYLKSETRWYQNMPSATCEEIDPGDICEDIEKEFRDKFLQELTHENKH